MNTTVEWLALAGLAFSSAAPRATVPPETSQAQRVRTPKDQRDAAVAAMSQRRFAEAETRFVDYLRAAPTDHGAWNMLGVSQFAQKRYHAAAESFAKCDQHGPPDEQVLTNLGASQFLSERLADARRTLERALERFPDSSRSQLFLARIAVQEGDFEAAEQRFRAATGGPAPDPASWFHYGVFLLQERRLDEAKGALERTLELDPAYGAAYNTLGLVLQRQGDRAGAQRCLRRFKELTEVEIGEQRQAMRVSALLRATQKEIENGNLEAALSAALEAATEGPQYAVVHQTVADAYRRLGRTAEAEAAAARARALEAGPRDAGRPKDEQR